MRNKNLKIEGFTLIELLVVIAIVGLLASIALLALNQTRVKARDTQRLANLQQIVKALALYYQDNGRYPDPTCPCGGGGWETSSADPDNFIEALQPYLAKTPVDPINRNIGGVSLFGPRAGEYYFAYYRYAPAPGYCGCNTSSTSCVNVTKPIAVLVARKMEELVPQGLPDAGMPLPSTVNLPRGVCGDPGGDGICTQADYYSSLCRDWSQEFDVSFILPE